MAHIAPDHRVSTHEAFKALDASSERLKQAMIDSARNPQDKGKLSEAEFQKKIVESPLDRDFVKLDEAIYTMAGSIYGQSTVGKRQIDEAIGQMKRFTTTAAGHDGLLSKRAAAAAGLQEIYAAALQLDITAGKNRAQQT